MEIFASYLNTELRLVENTIEFSIPILSLDKTNSYSPIKNKLTTIYETNEVVLLTPSNTNKTSTIKSCLHPDSYV
jgi:hypothetical protein